MLSNEKRLDEIEEALMLFCAIMGSEPTDATDEGRNLMRARGAELMQGMTDRMAKRKEGKF